MLRCDDSRVGQRGRPSSVLLSPSCAAARSASVAVSVLLLEIVTPAARHCDTYMSPNGSAAREALVSDEAPVRYRTSEAMEAGRARRRWSSFATVGGSRRAGATRIASSSTSAVRRQQRMTRLRGGARAEPGARRGAGPGAPRLVAGARYRGWGMRIKRGHVILLRNCSLRLATILGEAIVSAQTPPITPSLDPLLHYCIVLYK